MSNTEDFIFLTSGESNNLIKAPNTPYALEQDLQTLVAENPELLLVGDTSEEGALRWMIVALTGWHTRCRIRGRPLVDRPYVPGSERNTDFCRGETIDRYPHPPGGRRADA